MKRIRKKKGFTLIELLVSITIIGVLALFVLPSLTNMTSSNKTKKYEAYETAFETSARLYAEKYGKDNWTKDQKGCIKLKLNEAIDEGLLKDYKEVKDEKCDNDKSYVIISKTSSTSYNYKYYTYLYCVNKKTNKVVYEDSDGDKVDAGSCTNIIEHSAPSITGITVWSKKNRDTTATFTSSWSKTATFKVTIEDESGLNNGQVAYGYCAGDSCIPTDWSVKEIPYVEKSTTSTAKYSFYLTTADNVTSNNYHLVVRIISLQDLLGNYIKSDDPTKYITRSPAVKVDNTPPTCEYDRTEDNRDWTNGSGSPIKKTRIFAILCNDSDRSGSTTSVNQSGCVIHNASSDDMTLTSYYASNSKGVYWGSYIWTTDSGADYAYSSAIRNSDSKREDYKKNITYYDKDTNQAVASETISDRVGNTTVCTNFPTKKVNLDTTPPVCNGNNSKTNWTNSPYTISQKCEDTNKGALKAENTSKCVTPTFDVTYTTKKSAIITIKDNASNETKCPVDVYVDMTDPVCGSNNGPAAGNWKSGTRKVTVNCSDGTDQSGCKKGSYSNTWGGDHSTETIRIYDNVNNYTDCPVNVYVDNSAPSINVNNPPGRYHYSVSVSPGCYDGYSGVGYSSGFSLSSKTCTGSGTVKCCDNVNNCTPSTTLSGYQIEWPYPVYTYSFTCEFTKSVGSSSICGDGWTAIDTGDFAHGHVQCKKLESYSGQSSCSCPSGGSLSGSCSSSISGYNWSC